MPPKNTNIDIASDVEEMMFEIIGDHFGLPAPSLSVDTHIMNDCGADWFDQMELIMTVEELFSIKIPEESTSRVEKIGDIIDAIIKISPSKSHLETAKKAWRMASRRKT